MKIFHILYKPNYTVIIAQDERNPTDYLEKISKELNEFGTILPGFIYFDLTTCNRRKNSLFAIFFNGKEFIGNAEFVTKKNDMLFQDIRTNVNKYLQEHYDSLIKNSLILTKPEKFMIKRGY